MSTRLPSRPALPRRNRLPGRASTGQLPEIPAPKAAEPVTDEFGLSVELFGQMSPLGRQYLAACLDYLKLPKDVSPTRSGFGTIPEAVFFGGLLAHGFLLGAAGSRSFAFQSAMLGGRQTPGGTVVDFMLYHGGRRIAVYVESVFHTKDNPFGGLAKIGEDDARFTRLLATQGVDALLQVNRGGEGHPFEHGPDSLITADFRRVLATG